VHQKTEGHTYNQSPSLKRTNEKNTHQNRKISLTHKNIPGTPGDNVRGKKCPNRILSHYVQSSLMKKVQRHKVLIMVDHDKYTLVQVGHRKLKSQVRTRQESSSH